MKKYILVITILSLIFTVACTQIPISEETGLGPGEYGGIGNTEEIKKENLSLKEELENTKEELDSIRTELKEQKDDYLSLAKSNENIIFKLEEAESKLKIVESEDIPNFNIESTDANSIVSYLNDSSNLIDDSIKGIDIISTDDSIVFRTLGYGKNYSQIFIWNKGENEPLLIDGASFSKEGSYEWLDKYILIKDSGKNKLLDIENKKIISSFDEPQKMILLEGTTTLLLKGEDNKFVLYDFVNNTNKEVNLDNNRYSDFNLQNGTLVFSGTYVEDDVDYEMRASLKLNKLKEVYEIKAVDEAEEEIGEDTV